MDVGSEPTRRKAIPKITITGEVLLDYEIEKMPTLVDPFFQQTGIVALGGSSDTGKSCFLNQLAIAIVTGEKDFLGFQLNTRYQNVIYVSTEDEPEALAFRLTKQNVKHYEPKKLAGLRYWFSSDHLVDILDQALTEQKADCVMIDAFSDIFGDNDINQVSKVRTVLNAYNELAKRRQCLIIFLHHTGKRTSEGVPSKHDLLGSQGFEAKMRAVLLLRKDKHDESIRHLVIAKGNYLSPEMKRTSFVLKFNDLVFKNTGNKINREELGSTQSKPWHIEALDLRNQGKSLREIEEALKGKGYKNCSKSSVENYIKNSKVNDSKAETGISKQEELKTEIIKNKEVTEPYNPEQKANALRGAIAFNEADTDDEEYEEL